MYSIDAALRRWLRENEDGYTTSREYIAAQVSMSARVAQAKKKKK